MHLYFVRHGESTANLRHEFSNSGCKHPLTEEGLAQAQAAACELAGVPVARIYTSPVLRAVQTAEILAAALHAPLEVTEALREYSVGIYEGTDDPLGWELHRQVQEDWHIHGRLDSKMPGGESYRDLERRFLPFVAGLLGESGEQRLVLVGHGGLYLAMLPAILRNITPAFAWQQGLPYAGYVVAESGPDGLCCRSWCGVAVGLEPWPQGRSAQSGGGNLLR